MAAGHEQLHQLLANESGGSRDTRGRHVWQPDQCGGRARWATPTNAHTGPLRQPYI